MSFTVEDAVKEFDNKGENLDEGLRDYLWAIAQMYASDATYDKPSDVLEQFKISDMETFTSFLQGVARPMSDGAVHHAVLKAVVEGMDPRLVLNTVLEFGMTDGFVAGLLVGRKQTQESSK